MEHELFKQFIKRSVIRTIIFAIIMSLVTAVAGATMPIVSNEMALGQMQNSNEMFVLMETYNRIKPLFAAAYTAVTVWFVYTICRDTYKFIKTIKPKNEKEKN